MHLLLIVITALFVLNGCSDSSFMEDVKFFDKTDADSTQYSVENDPSKLIVSARIEKEISNNGDVSTESRIYINKGILSPFIVITDGTAMIENSVLAPKQESLNLTNSAFYFSDKIDLLPNNKYDLTLTLSDQEPYTGQLETPATTISALTIPSVNKMNEPITVDWGTAIPNDSVRISYMKTYGNNSKSSSGITVSADESFYTFPADYFTPGKNGNDTLGVSSIEMTISHRVGGSFEPVFHDDSEFYAVTSISKSFTIE